MPKEKSEVCVICGKPRKRKADGSYLMQALCEEHQREAWRKYSQTSKDSAPGGRSKSSTEADCRLPIVPYSPAPPLIEPGGEVIPDLSTPKLLPVRVLRLCPHCGRAVWLERGEAFACNCVPLSGTATLALIVPETGEVTHYAAREVAQTTIEGSYALGVAELLHAGLRVAIPVDESIHPVV